MRGVEDSSRLGLERVNSRQNNRDYSAIKNELYEDVLYRMPQVEDDPLPAGYKNYKNVGNLNNLPTVKGSNLGIVGS